MSNYRPNLDDDDAAKVALYLRGVTMVHDITTRERTDLLVAIGYDETEIRQHFPTLRSISSETERDFIRQQHVPDDGFSIMTAPETADDCSLHPRKKEMLEALYELATDVIVAGDAVPMTYEPNQYFGALMTRQAYVSGKQQHAGTIGK